MAGDSLRLISRDEALANGLKRYFTGLPCVNGHVAPRSVGVSNECIECKRARDRKYSEARKTEKAEYDKAYRERHKERDKPRRDAYRKQNREKMVAYRQQYYSANAGEYKAYRERNREKRNQQRREWGARNRDRVQAYSAAYDRERMRVDVQYKLACKLRQRLAVAVRDGAKGGSAVDMLGCTIAELKDYLEGQFLPGMSWDNWGRRGWHIDHKKPLAMFDLTDREHARVACHYTNLQPLWAADNLKKGAKAITE